MIKLMRFSDTHHHIKPPYATRTGEYHAQVMNKIDEIIQIAREEQVDLIVHDGDVLHSPVPEYEVFNSVLGTYREFGVPIFVNPGNHDMLGDDINSLKHTGLGGLEQAKVVNVLRGKEDYRVFSKDGITLSISGTPFNEVTTPKDLMIKKPTGVDFAYHSIHHMLIAEKFNEKVRFVSLPEILDTGADITSCGHNHIGMAPFQYAGKLFLSDGSISRLRKPEMAHQPKVTIIEIDKSGFVFRHRYLTRVKYAESLFVSTERSQAFPMGASDGPVFVSSRGKHVAATDVPELLTTCANELGLQRSLPAALSMYSTYKQKAVSP